MLPITTESLRVFLHVLAATLWVGGQLTLAALVPALRGSGAEVTRVAARAFNRVAWPAYAVLVVTGVWNVLAEWGEAGADWRATVYAKSGLVVASGVSAYLHTRATSRRGLAVWGAASGLTALATLFVGVLLGVNH